MELYIKTCKKYQLIKNRKILYGFLQTNIIEVFKPWNYANRYFIGPYEKSIRQQHTGGTTIKNDESLNLIIIIDTPTGCFKIFEVLCFVFIDVER